MCECEETVWSCGHKTMDIVDYCTQNPLLESRCPAISFYQDKTSSDLCLECLVYQPPPTGPPLPIIPRDALLATTARFPSSTGGFVSVAAPVSVPEHVTPEQLQTPGIPRAMWLVGPRAGSFDSNLESMLDASDRIAEMAATSLASPQRGNPLSTVANDTRSPPRAVWTRNQSNSSNYPQGGSRVSNIPRESRSSALAVRRPSAPRPPPAQNAGSSRGLSLSAIRSSRKALSKQERNQADSSGRAAKRSKSSHWEVKSVDDSEAVASSRRSNGPETKAAPSDFESDESERSTSPYVPTSESNFVDDEYERLRSRLKKRKR